MKTHFLLVLLVLLCSSVKKSASQNVQEISTQELLQKLDVAIENKTYYQKNYVLHLDSLKKEASKSQTGKRIHLYQQIFNGYSRFQTDSATIYLEKIKQETNFSNDTILQNYLHLGYADIYAVTGLYAEAVEQLKMVRLEALGDMRLSYYHQCRTVYGWMAAYAVSGYTQKKMNRLTQCYRDSIILCSPTGVNRNIVRADSMLVNGQPLEALRLSQADLSAVNQQEKAYLYYNMAQAYHQLGENNQYIHYLALTALADIQRGITEYQALAELAQAVYERNDITRAYKYLICSMEDANYCKARLRTIAASNIFPIIDKAYKNHEKKHRKRERWFIYSLGACSLLLLAVVIYLRRQMKKLAQTRRQLAHIHQELQETHNRLVHTDRMKEEYIGRYLERCRGYLDTLSNYRRQLYKLAKSHQTEELYNLLKSETLIKEEQERFYHDFDKAFLNLFPDFIEKFNALLEPEAQTLPKGNEILTTELRIFALIRLGVHDSAQIAHFLNYSVATIYTYRSKLRNRSVCGKEKLEEMVMNIP